MGQSNYWLFHYFDYRTDKKSVVWTVQELNRKTVLGNRKKSFNFNKGKKISVKIFWKIWEQKQMTALKTVNEIFEWKYEKTRFAKNRQNLTSNLKNRKHEDFKDKKLLKIAKNSNKVAKKLRRSRLRTELRSEGI